MSEDDATPNTLDFISVPLGEIAHIEMGQSPDSKYVIDDPLIGHPFLQGNAEFGSVFPEPKYGCLRPAKLCKADDVLISVRAPVGAVNIADRDYCIGRGLAAIRVRGIKPSLVAEVIARQSLELRRVSQGTTFEAINKRDLLTLSLKLPPPNEWAHVAAILDTLDTAIHETEAIIAKLKAVKQGLLHDLLTRGIAANGELRPPQTEAPHLYQQSPLGWIPKEWNVRPLSSCIASLDAGVSVNSEDRPHGANEIGVLKTSALSNGRFRSNQNKTVVANEVYLVREPVAADSILISRMNTPQLVGESCYVAESWPALFLPDRIWQLKKTESDSVHMRWLSYVLLTSNFRAYVEVHATGTSGSMKNLPKSRVKEMPIAFPKLDEQILISERIAKADDVITSECKQLVKLKQTKSGLMDDLLTGRVRVTPLLEAAAP